MDQQTTHSPKSDSTLVINDFELVTRWMRWLAIYALILCFPFATPRSYYAYGLAAVAVLYNLTRYSRLFMRFKWYASTFCMLLVDNVFLAVLLALIGDVKTPFTILVIMTIITAGYRYRLRGTLTVVCAQLFWIWFILSRSFFYPVQMNTLQTGIATTLLLVGVGVFVERLTRMERKELTSLERLSQQLEADRKHLTALVDSLHDAIFVVDDHGRVTDSNAAAEKLCDRYSNMRGQPFAKVLQLKPHVNQDGEVVNLLKTPGPQHRRDLSVWDRNGAVTDLDITVQPVRLEGTRSTDYVVVCKDITRERSIDEERSEFISVASHELRTPITIMEAALSTALLARDKMDEQLRTIIEQAHTHSLYLANIVKDLSLLSAASNDNLPVQLTQIDPKKLLRQMAHDFDAQARQRGLKLQVLVKPGVPPVLSTETHVREILQNYITNAIKYSTEGTVVLEAVASKQDGIRFSVHDTGIGISPADQKHLFTKFFRSEDYRTRQTNGTGLGLYLCKELALRLNGEVWCESELNKGSTFYLEIPPISHLARDRKEVIQAEVASLVQDI